MRIWVITDTHFNHTQKMIEYCNRPLNYEERIISAVKATTDTDDVLIHLGDVSLGKEEKWHRLLTDAALCRTWLIRGNHDGKSISWYLDHGWDCVCRSCEIKMFGLRILFSHMPREDNGYDLNVHGHFHNSDHHLHEPELVAIKNEKQYLLSIEYTEYKPILLDTIVKQFNRN